ncbi:MAG: hypothetical protein IGS39_13595 [Calothrix sp. C42_A2020_038]|nr:hypothetical protein [Calothrix sp. C42_A2020_038]
MELLRIKLHRLIEELQEEELEQAWDLIYGLHCDFEMLEAIQQVKRLQQPWDTLTHDEAVRYLTMT